MDLDVMLEKYANLVINCGLKIKKDDYLVIRGSVELTKLMNLCAREAYKSGARKVFMEYRDGEFAKIMYENESIDSLVEVPQFFIDKYNYYGDKRAKILSITGEDPNAFKDIDSEKISKANIASSKALKDYNQKMMNNVYSWCVIGGATKKWSKAVFPELSYEDAIMKLWEEIFYTVRLFDDDPKKSMDSHVEDLNRYAKFLNENRFKSLHFKSNNGTDLDIKLPKDYVFAAADDKNENCETFIANIPTEEVFTMPYKYGVNGIVYNTKPLNYNGNLIDDFYLKFENGKVIEFDAKVGRDILEGILNSDDGSKYLGEVALVPYDSPISNRDILFLNTLYDENASCHLAIGKAYPTNVDGGEKLPLEKYDEIGINDSLVHVDFMIGNESTNIVGTLESGEEIEIFKDGNFVI